MSANTRGLNLNRSRDIRTFPSATSLIVDILGLITLVALAYYIVPEKLQFVVFDLVLRNLAFILPWILPSYLAYRLYNGEYNNQRRIITAICTTGLACAALNAGLYYTRGYFTFLEFAKYNSREDLVQTSAHSIRFTPLTNACNDMANSISISSEHVECKYTSPAITPDGRFSYVAPIVPSGLYQVFEKKNPGFMVLDDSTDVTNSQKHVRRINDEQTYGPEMQWFDNLERVLVKTDFFAKYGKPHYIALDPKWPDKYTTVIPKVKFAHFFQLPYWAGVTLIHSDGKIEDLSKDQALQDVRLKGKWIYPVELENKYVRLQNYAIGWGIFSELVRVPGKLEVEKLPGENQFPFLIQGKDGNPYLVTGTKGEGSARGLFRMYFRNAFTGEGSYHEFKPNEVIYGVGAALTRVTNIPGYNWSHGESGNMKAVEPVYITKDGDTAPYWKFTITNIQNAGISATAVSSGSRPDEIKVFKTRDEFELWIHDQKTTPDKKESSFNKEEIIARIKRIEQELAAVIGLLK